MILTPRCFERNCIHFRGANGNDELDEHLICVAFPEGIPNDIAFGDNLHLVSQSGDNGVIYEQAKPEDRF